MAQQIRSDYGSAKVITTTNVFAHMAPLGEVMRGISALLDKDGIFITESHYLLDVLKGAQYDTIYHEHIRTYSLKSLIKLFEFYKMEVFHVERADRYGGNIRAYVARKGVYSTNASVAALLELENQEGLNQSKIYENFRENAYQTRDDLMEFVFRTKRLGQRLVGNSCPGRSSTLLNFVG